MYAGSFWNGFYDENERIRRNRLEYARAFNEFRQSNPHATLDEMQSFVDMTFGGQNWLYGAPSNQVLQTIATRNQERFQQDQALRQIDILNRQAQAQSSVMDMATRIASSTDDPASAMDQFNQIFGQNPLARQLVTPQTIQGLQQRARTEFVTKNLDIAVRALEAGQDINSLFPGSSRGQLDLLRSAAEGEKQRRDRDRNDRVLAQETQRIAGLIGAGVMDGYEPPAGLDDNMSRRLRDMFGSAVQSRRRELINNEQDQLRGNAEFRNRILLGDVDGARQVIRERMNLRLGERRLTPEEEDAILNDIRTGAQAQQSQMRQTEIQAISQQAIQLADQQAEQQRARALGQLGDKAMRDRTFGTGVHQQRAAEAVEQMLKSEKLTLDSETIATMANVAKTDPRFRQFMEQNGNTVDAARAFFLQHPDVRDRLTNAQPNAVREAARRQALEARAFHRPQQRAEQFVREETAAAQANFQANQQALTQQIQAVQSNPRLTGIERRAQLERLRNIIQERARADIARLERDFTLRQNWVDPTGRPLTQEDVQQILRLGEQNAAALLEQINNALASVQPDPPRNNTMAGPAGQPGAAASAPPVAGPQMSPDEARMILGPRASDPRAVEALNRAREEQAARARAQSEQDARMNADPRIAQLMAERARAAAARDFNRVAQIEQLLQAIAAGQ